MGSLIKPSLSLSLPQTFAFSSPNSEKEVLKCIRRNKVRKQLPMPMKMTMMISRRKPVPIRSQYVDTNDQKIDFSRKGSGNHLVIAASDDELLGSEVLRSNAPSKTFQEHFDAFSRFSRLYIFVAKVVALVAVSLILVEKLSDFSPSYFTGLFQVIAACFLTHIYANGLNHLEDIEIDKINKPYHPLASGEYSIRTGVILTISCQLMAFALGWIVGSRHLFLFVLINFLVATAYSLNVPYLRWKSDPYLSVFSNFSLVVPLGLAAYLHMQTFAFGRPAFLSKVIIFALVKASIASIVHTLSKDIPDVAGDAMHGVRSFAVQFGEKNVFWICIFLMEMGYLAGILVGLTSSNNWCKFITVGGHIYLALKLLSHAQSVDVGSKEETSSFYMFLLKLFGVESILIPFIR